MGVMSMTLRLPEDLDHAVADLAKRRHRSKHAAIIALIADGVARAAQDDADHNARLFAELRASGPGGQLTGEQVAADLAEVRAERDAELLGDL